MGHTRKSSRRAIHGCSSFHSGHQYLQNDLNRLGSDLRIRDGGHFENFEVARQQLMMPVTFALIFLLLLGAAAPTMLKSSSQLTG
jgi:hypothetical protein